MGLEDNQKLQQHHFHVLVVDDSVIDRKLLERLLKDSSCKATFVDSGDKALKYLGLLDNASSINSDQSLQKEGIKVNLIMTDYCMPGMSGYELLKQIKGSSSWKDVPVVIMSSENVPSRITMCLEGGAEEFLFKPLQLSDMKKLLQPYFVKSFDNSSGQVSFNSSIASYNDNNNNSDHYGMSNWKMMSYVYGYKLQFASTIVATILQFWRSM